MVSILKEKQHLAALVGGLACKFLNFTPVCGGWKSQRIFEIMVIIIPNSKIVDYFLLGTYVCACCVCVRAQG